MCLAYVHRWFDYLLILMALLEVSDTTEKKDKHSFDYKFITNWFTYFGPSFFIRIDKVFNFVLTKTKSLQFYTHLQIFQTMHILI